MATILKFKEDLDDKAVKELTKQSSISCDTEGSGLQIPHRDRLSLIQFSTGKNDAYIIKPSQKYECPNVVKVLENSKVTKIFHYSRFFTFLFISFS